MVFKGQNGVYDGEVKPSLAENLKLLKIDNPDAEEIVKQIDEMFNNASKKEVKGLQTDKDGKVDISSGYYFHEIPLNSSEESIVSRAENGILPTERFGQLESAGEMRFCVGVSYCDNLQEGSKLRKRYVGNPMYDFWDCKMSQTGRLSLIIDPSICETSLEFLSFVAGKQPEDEKDTKVLKFVKSLSPKADTIVNGEYKTSYTDFNWRAIVGGIPPQYIVGVFINEEYQNSSDAACAEENLKLAQFCAKTFNCPLINQEGKCIQVQKEMEDDFEAEI